MHTGRLVAARRRDQRRVLHDVRGRRRDRRHADRLHRVLVLGARPDRVAAPPVPAPHAGVAAHAVRPRPSCSTPDETLRFIVCDDRSVVLTADGRELGELAAGDAVSCHGGRQAGAHRHLRAARLPPDPEGQVRPRRPLARCCVELHVVDLGIVADLNLVLAAPGITAITGETGAGKTLLVEAVELLVGGRADAALVRDGRDRGAGRGPLRPSRRPARRPCSRASCPRDGRSRAYVDGRLATVGELAERRRAPRRPARPARPPVAARPGGAARRARPLRGRAGARRARRATATRGRRCARSTPSSRRSAVTPAPGPARSTSCATRSRRSPRPGSRTPSEDVALEAEEALLADAVAHRDALAQAYEALEGPASTRSGTRSPRSTAGRRSPSSSRPAARRRRESWPTSSWSCATRSSGSTRIPNGSRPCAAAATSSTSSAASTAPPSPT